MAPSSSQREILRWMFQGTGWLLLVWQPLIGQHFTSTSDLAPIFFPGHVIAQALFRVMLGFDTLLAAIACLRTARGIRLGRPWARWMGFAACGLMLPLLPLFTLVGLAGLSRLFVTPWTIRETPESAQAKVAAKTKDYWLAKRKSAVQGGVAFVLSVLSLVAMGLLGVYAKRLGMRGWDPGLLCLPVLLLVDVSVHELGHATVAWALYNRMRAISIGPFVFRDYGYGFQFTFDWKRLFGFGGFVSSASLSDENLRMKLIAEVAGGPAAALLGAVVSVAAFVSLPGTFLQSWWWVPGYMAILFMRDFLLNLLPAGYSDGSMLWHLSLQTEAGNLLMSRSVVAQMYEDCEALHGRAELSARAELAAAALKKAQEGGERNAALIAYCQVRLGSAFVSLQEWSAAQAQACECLTHEAECAADPGLAIASWSQLLEVAYRRHHIAEVGHAYARFLAAAKASAQHRHGHALAVLTILRSRAHFYAADYEQARLQAEHALLLCPPRRAHLLLRAEALSLQARALVAMDALDSGRAAAAQAAAILSSAEIPAGRRNEAANDQVDVGDGLWRAGESEMSVELVRDAIRRLEEGQALAAAAQHRIRLASMVRQTGDLKEAARCLPEEAGLPERHRRLLLVERARLHLARGRTSDAIAECHRALPLWQGEPVETAIVEALLAEAHLEAGEVIEAAILARKALDVLEPWQHYETASCLITLALTEPSIRLSWNPEFEARARQWIEADLLLLPPVKQRMLHAMSARLERHRKGFALVSPRDTGVEEVEIAAEFAPVSGD